MTDLDDLLSTTTPEPVTAVSLVPGRHQHTWTVCTCGAQRDMEAPRRGRSARRLGGDTERRIERTYGPRKVGEFGDAVDLIGRDFVWQSKATRDDPPAWLAAIVGPVIRPAPALVIRCAAAMAPIANGRAPLVIQTFVRRDGPKDERTRDWIWVRALDWVDLHGGLVPSVGAWYVMDGRTFLAVHGRDSEVPA